MSTPITAPSKPSVLQTFKSTVMWASIFALLLSMVLTNKINLNPLNQHYTERELRETEVSAATGNTEMSPPGTRGIGIAFGYIILFVSGLNSASGVLKLTAWGSHRVRGLRPRRYLDIPDFEPSSGFVAQTEKGVPSTMDLTAASHSDDETMSAANETAIRTYQTQDLDPVQNLITETKPQD